MTTVDLETLGLPQHSEVPSGFENFTGPSPVRVQMPRFERVGKRVRCRPTREPIVIEQGWKEVATVFVGQEITMESVALEAGPEAYARGAAGENVRVLWRVISRSPEDP